MWPARVRALVEFVVAYTPPNLTASFHCASIETSEVLAGDGG
jgi:hypothetical protein